MGLPCALSALAYPDAALARGGPAGFMDGVIMAWMVIGLTGLGLWLLVCLGCLWPFLRACATRREKIVCCLVAAVVFVALPLIDRMMLSDSLQRLFFALPFPVVLVLGYCLAMVYIVLALLGFCWGMALILDFCFGRDERPVEAKERNEEGNPNHSADGC